MGRKAGEEGEKGEKRKEGGRKGKGKTLTELEDSSGSRGKDCQPEITRFNSVLRVTSRALLDLAHISPHTPPSFTLLLQMCWPSFPSFTHFLPLTPRPLLYCALCFNSFPLLFRLTPPTQPLLSALVITSLRSPPWLFCPGHNPIIHSSGTMISFLNQL